MQTDSRAKIMIAQLDAQTKLQLKQMELANSDAQLQAQIVADAQAQKLTEPPPIHGSARWAAAKDAGVDWTTSVPRLGDHGPGLLTVDDLTEVCSLGLGFRIDYDHNVDWELTSPMARSMPARHRSDHALDG